jgi:DNA-binding NtrC family response regulator
MRPLALPVTARAVPIRVLVADDQADVLEALALLLKGQDIVTVKARSPAEVLAAVEADEFDAVIMDLNYARDTTSGHEGLDLLGRVLVLDATLPVLVMTAWGARSRARCRRSAAARATTSRNPGTTIAC